MFRVPVAVRRATTCSNSNIPKIRTLVTQAATAEDGTLEVAKTVAYPEILEVTPKAIHRRLQEEYFDRMKKLDTVEEKLIALNIPKYYGWPSFVLKECVIPYDFLPFSQFVTRTVVNEVDNLPTSLTGDQISRLTDKLKQELEKVILFEEYYVRPKHEVERLYMEEEELPFYNDQILSEMKTQRLAKEMNSAIVRVLASDYPHLISVQTDFNPRLEAFWRVGGFYATEQDKDLRRKKEVDESMIEDPIDRFIQYFGSPILQIRSRNPLQTLAVTPLDKGEMENRDQDTEEGEQITGVALSGHSLAPADENAVDKMVDYPLQEYRYSPDLYLEIPRKRYHGGIIPGFWPNDPSRFGIVSYHSTSHLSSRSPAYGSEENVEARHSQAILASYAWTYGQACYQGFTTYNDITYPFVTQTILTDGKVFSFYQYQLNTIVLHSDKNESDNPLKNECYATVPTELYHKVDSDKVTGWNDNALLNLLNLYTKDRRNPAEIDLSPYLGKNIKFVSQIPEDKRRKWLFKIHRYLMSHRPRHQLEPEIYDWERIYKIDNKKRVTDARKRFFEKFLDPINDRKLNDHEPKRVPKSLRLRLKKDRWEEQFYPDVFPDYHEIV